MAKDNNLGFPIGISGAIVMGVAWTAVAGTLWQWVPICGAIAAVYGVTKVFDAEAEKAKKPKFKKPKSKKDGDKCC